MLARDHYATLGVAPDADDDAIAQAYRHLSRRYHPDVNPGDPSAAAVYERVQAAYGVLADPERRARYDRDGSLAEAAGVDSHGISVEILATDERTGTYAELFRRLRDHARRAGPVTGAEIVATVDVPMAQAGRGRRASVRLRRRVPCPECTGRGRIELDRTRPCKACAGSGVETFAKGPLSVTCSCAGCNGSGLVTGTECAACAGNGATASDEALVVRVPAGVVDGQEIRVPGAGHAGQRGGSHGDLVVRCRIVPAPGFQRHGADLHIEHPISVFEAVLGGRVAVRDLEGEEATLRIPPNTAGGSVFRIRQRGLMLPDGRRGDMLVRVAIQVPEILDEDSKELVRRLAERHPFDPREARRGTQR